MVTGHWSILKMFFFYFYWDYYTYSLAIHSITRGVMLRHDRTEGWLEILGAVSSDP